MRWTETPSGCLMYCSLWAGLRHVTLTLAILQLHKALRRPLSGLFHSGLETKWWVCLGYIWHERFESACHLQHPSLFNHFKARTYCTLYIYFFSARISVTSLGLWFWLTFGNIPVTRGLKWLLDHGYNCHINNLVNFTCFFLLPRGCLKMTPRIQSPICCLLAVDISC